MNTTFPNDKIEEIRDRLHALRHNYFDNMDKHLLNLERVLASRGANVLWSKDNSSLLGYVQDIVEQKSFSRICSDSSIQVNGKLSGCDFIAPSDLENSVDDVDLLVIDADFAVCDSGSLVFIDRKSQKCFNKVKNIMAVVKIDQVITSVADLSLFLSFRNSSKENKLPDNVRIIQSRPQYTPPTTSVYSTEGVPEQHDIGLTVVINLNDIENILSVEDLIPSLYCIKCGRCLDICPVAKANEKDPVSPIDIVKLNTLDSYNRAQHIFKNTTFCGACDDVCPVKVPLTRLMLYEMQASNMSTNVSRPKHLYSIFKKRSSTNKFNNRILKFFFIRRFFGRNKTLAKYYRENSADFFNITYTPPQEDNPNEIFKDSDFE